MKNIWVGALRVLGVATLNQAIPSVAVARTNDLGEYRVDSLQSGQYVIVAKPGHGPIGAAANGIPDSRTYFSGTLDFPKAQLVTVGPGQTVTGLDFRMTAPVFEVSGVAVDDAGRVVPDALVVLDADWSLFGGLKGSSRTDPDGRFLFTLISSGDYMLTVTNPGNEPKPVTRQTPFVRASVVDADVSGLVIQVPNALRPSQVASWLTGNWSRRRQTSRSRRGSVAVVGQTMRVGGSVVRAAPAGGSAWHSWFF